MDITLYHATHTRSLRVLWLLEEMAVPYELVKVDLSIGNTGGQAYQKINPLQKVPAVLVDGVLLQESTAILEFLANRVDHENLIVTKDHPDYGRFLQWLHGGETGFGMYLSLYFGNTVLLPKEQRNADLAAWAAGHLQKMFALFGKELASRNFIAEDKFTIADISVGYVCYGMELVGKIEEYAPKNVNQYWQNLKTRPALIKALSIL